MNQTVKNFSKTTVWTTLLLCALGMMHFTTGNCKESTYFSLLKNSPTLSTRAQSESTVYVTKTGKRYHSKQNCSGLNNAKAVYPMSKSEAAKKYTPCKICYK
jgi:hypothetical protein